MKDKLTSLHPTVVTPHLHRILTEKFGAEALKELNYVKAEMMPLIPENINDFTVPNSACFMVGETFLERTRAKLREEAGL